MCTSLGLPLCTFTLPVLPFVYNSPAPSIDLFSVPAFVRNSMALRIKVVHNHPSPQDCACAQCSIRVITFVHRSQPLQSSLCTTAHPRIALVHKHLFPGISLVHNSQLLHFSLCTTTYPRIVLVHNAPSM